jgi:hypothetical protein
LSSDAVPSHILPSDNPSDPKWGSFVKGFVFLFQNDTMRVLFSYHGSEPPGQYADGPLPYHGSAHRGSRSLYLTERFNKEEPLSEDTFTWDLTNEVSNPLFVLRLMAVSF